MEPIEALARLESEAAALKKTIDDSQKRLDDITTLLRLLPKYQSILSKDQPKSIKGTVEIFREWLDEQSRRQITKRQLITDAAEVILSDGVRRFSVELIKELHAQGIDVGGTNAKVNLASYLSKDNRFESNKKAGGWTLTSASKMAKPNDAPTSLGFSFSSAVQRPQSGR